MLKKYLNDYTLMWTSGSLFTLLLRILRKLIIKKHYHPAMKDARGTRSTKNILETHVLTYKALKRCPYGKQSKIGITQTIYQVEAGSFFDKDRCELGPITFRK